MLLTVYDEHVTVLFDVDASASLNVHVALGVAVSPEITPEYDPNVQLAALLPLYVLSLHVGAPPVNGFFVIVIVFEVFVSV